MSYDPTGFSKMSGDLLSVKSHVFSPYRICPLGAHVDHQLGFVTGFTLDKGIHFVFNPREDSRVIVSSSNYEINVDFVLSDIPKYEPGFWGNYMHGSCEILVQRYNITKGIEGVVSGSLPIGGLSSSAAVLSAYLLALAYVNKLTITPNEYIGLAKNVENNYIGLKNGILDQATNILSVNGYLLHLNTRTEEHRLIRKPLNMANFSVGVFFSGVSQSLISTDYNRRVTECKQAAAYLNNYQQNTRSKERDIVLGDINEQTFIAHGSGLPTRLFKRAKHYFDEQNRVVEGVAAWRLGDLDRFGKLMYLSGESSVNYYESGCPEIISLFRILKNTVGIFGARFSGAGYRGCVIAIVDPEFEEQIRLSVTSKYLKEYPQYKDVFRIDYCGTGGGVHIL